MELFQIQKDQIGAYKWPSTVYKDNHSQKATYAPLYVAHNLLNEHHVVFKFAAGTESDQESIS